MLNSLARLIGT